MLAKLILYSLLTQFNLHPPHTRFYIGEWHTHPEDKPKPSAVDYNSIKNNYHTALLVVPLLLMIIVGTQTFHICVYNGKKFVEVVPKIV